MSVALAAGRLFHSQPAHKENRATGSEEGKESVEEIWRLELLKEWCVDLPSLTSSDVNKGTTVKLQASSQISHRIKKSRRNMFKVDRAY